MSQLLWTTLGIVCPTCDEHNAPRASRCASCGTALLDAGPSAKPAVASPARPPAPERTGTNPRIPIPGAAPGGTNPKIPAPAAAPGGTNPKIPIPAASAPAVSAPVAAKPAAPAPGGTNPRIPMPGAAPGGTNPKIPIPPAARPAPAAAPPPAAAKPAAAPPGAVVAKGPEAPKPGARPVAEAVPPGMRPSTRHTPSHGLPPAELEPPPPAPPAVAPVKAAAAPSKFALVVISGSSTGQRFRLSVQGCQVGRSRGAMLFPDDPFISPLHAAFSIREGRLHVRDEGSASGVLVTVHQELLPPGTLFAAGNHLFRYAGSLEPVPPVSGRPVVYGAPLPQALYLVEEVLVGGRAGRAVVTHGPLLTIGQSLCDLSFPNEEGMASRHCELTPTPAGATLRDLSGGLGTYVHLAGGERALNPGDRVRIGDQILQVETA